MRTSRASEPAREERRFLLTPLTGNTPWEEALEILGEDLILFGCLDPTIFASGDIRRIPAALDTLITPRLRESNFVLSPMADGIPVTSTPCFHETTR